MFGFFVRDTLLADEFEQRQMVMLPDLVAQIIEQFDHGKRLLWGLVLGYDEWNPGGQAGRQVKVFHDVLSFLICVVAGRVGRNVHGLL